MAPRILLLAACCCIIALAHGHEFVSRSELLLAAPLNCTAYCKYYVECMCGQPLPSKASCLACIAQHKSSFSAPSVKSIPCSYERAEMLCGADPKPSPSPSPPSPGPPSNATVYVSSTDGSDDNSGVAPTAPLRSLGKATEVAAELRAARMALAGSLVLNRTAIFTQQHSRLVVEQWQGKPAAVISGGVHLPSSGWTKDPAAPGVWSTALPSAAAEALTAQGAGSIYVNDQRRTVSRTKTFKWAAPLGPKNSAVSKRGFVYAADGDADPFAGWSLDAAHLADWRVAAFHSWTKAYHRVAAIFPSNRTIIFQNAASFGYGDYTYCSQSRFYVENAADIPLEPGTWRVDRASALLHYRPQAGESFPPADDGVVVPVLETLFQLQNARGMTLRQLSFVHAYSGDCGDGLGPACDRDAAMMAHNALSVQASAGVTLSDLRIRGVGGFGISAASSNGLVIERVGVQDAGAGGITVRSCVGVLVNNSIVSGFGRRFPAANGITLTSSRNGTVSYCDVSDGLYAGLAGGGTNDGGAYSRYVFNHIHGLGTESDEGLCDFGGYHGSNGGSLLPIYMLSNHIHNITAFANGGSGIYMDVSSTAFQVERNLIYDVNNAAVVWNVNPGVPQAWEAGATPTRILNNVLVCERDNAYYRNKAMTSQGGATHEPFGLGNEAVRWNGYRPAVFERNVVVVDATTAPSRGAWFAGVPCAQEEHPAPGCTFDLFDSFKESTLANNVYFNRSSTASTSSTPTFPGGCNVTAKSCGVPFTRGCSCRTWEEWTAAGEDKGSLWQTDPKLEGPLQLVTAPSVLALGIEPLEELGKAGADWVL